ncbi:AraC family transcriptional regulator [Caulobacter hibisci]|uniref:AraC family transcriptional regulator n=1 Tax=Caulobacter hibisci TaxID=2035993 RepID=A0ABS0T774_9CAUL|nr:helix-turn-helix domain-containing protein [Caulobacter hibisci]MBI1686743.1 AraC family transcriptional regulator [Caulobacter hibisci]
MALAIGDINSGAKPLPLGRTTRRFDGMLARASFGGLNLGMGRFAQGIAQTAAIPGVHTFMFATEPGIMRRVSGRKLFGRHIFHFCPNEQTVTGSPPDMPWAFGIVTMPFERLTAHAPNLMGVGHTTPLDDDRMFIAPPGAMDELVGLMNDISVVIQDTPQVIAEPQPARALAGAVVDKLMACLSQGLVKPDGAALGRHRQIVARFERALEERPEEMLSLGDICAVVGVAERTLNLACQEFLGEGAVRYARNRRLDLVHARLRASDPATTLVTSVAMDNGFWELGRFAQAYRLRFGERPSDTLRRKAH